jgi:phosphopantetheinyl transferase (holo-ACP synthase)
MTTQETYTLANELTNQEVDNIVGGWENSNEIETLRTFNALVSLGDSREMACATVIAKKYNSKDNAEFYNNAYTN